jgi:transcriptional regulator with XRE-family HTH domain
MPKSVFTGAHKHLVDVLIAARRRAGLTQTELAVRIGKNQRFVSLIERSQRRVDVIEFYAIARALGLDPVRLYSSVVKRLPSDVEI